jgi:hypothetical protein
MNNAAAGIGGFLGLGIFVFLIFVAIFSLFIPFFVYRIKNEIIRTNRKLEGIAEMLRTDGHEKGKICTYCGMRNKKLDLICFHCEKLLH